MRFLFVVHKNEEKAEQNSVLFHRLTLKERGLRPNGYFPLMRQPHVCNGTRGSVLHTFVFAFSANTKEASQSSLQRIAIDIMIGSHALSSPLKPRTFCALRPCLLADLPVCFCICILKYTTFFRAQTVFL